MAGSVYEGKSFDEAVRKGLEALRLSRAEAVITTIEEGKGGFLGFGSRPFRVSVARRPGGVIKEPAERPAAPQERGGRRGGREERSGRASERGGRGSREQAAQARAGGEERAGRGSRAGREEHAGSEPRRERAPREERPAREKQPQAAAPARPGREPRAGREERAGSEPRRERAPREERRPEPVAGASAAPVPPEIAAERGDDSPRKRRRRGRRGGRGRRRGGEEGEGEALNETQAPRAEMGSNGSDALHAQAVAEPVMPPPPRAFVAPPAMADLAPVMRMAEPTVGSQAYEPSTTPVTERDAPRERREPREHREGRGDRSRPQRQASPDGDEGGEGSGAPDMNADELAVTSKRLTEELLAKMGFEPKVSVLVDGDRVDVTVEVDRDDELLNGHQGETRQSLQHLLNRFLNKGDGSRYHLQLEVNDFWQQREVELETLARKLAEEAIARNAEVVSDSLNSQERRILHVTLKEDGRVKTFSLGTGMLKRVAVAPAGFPDRSEDEPAS